MSECKSWQPKMPAYLDRELSPDEKIRFEAHLRVCASCRAELSEIRRLIEAGSLIRADMEKALKTVDWEALPERIADRVFSGEETVIRRKRHFSPGFLIPKLSWSPVYAGLLIGLLLGSLATYVILRSPRAPLSAERGFSVPLDFLERVELEKTRRETIDYLERSQYLLLDFVQSPSASQTPFWKSPEAAVRTRDLLSRKRYFNPQLDKFRMAKAKALCDQIELLFQELTLLADSLSPEDYARLKNLIEDRQLLLKINIVTKELKTDEI